MNEVASNYNNSHKIASDSIITSKYYFHTIHTVYSMSVTMEFIRMRIGRRYIFRGREERAMSTALARACFSRGTRKCGHSPYPPWIQIISNHRT